MADQEGLHVAGPKQDAATDAQSGQIAALDQLVEERAANVQDAGDIAHRQNRPDLIIVLCHSFVAHELLRVLLLEPKVNWFNSIEHMFYCQ